MTWRQVRDGGRLREWQREDGRATVRLRERPDGSVAVRLDVLEQAADGPAYAQSVVADWAAAASLAERWRGENAGDGAEAGDGGGDGGAGP
jgi:hypothetical protein